MLGFEINIQVGLWRGGYGREYDVGGEGVVLFEGCHCGGYGEWVWGMGVDEYV